MNAPIALFVYNRLDCLKECVEALQRNKLASTSDLWIFSDGSKSETDELKVREVRSYLQTIKGFAFIRIVESKENVGLRDSIIRGVRLIVNCYGKVIVLEDDLKVSSYFLEYMNDALTKYERDERVISINGYCYPSEEKFPETFFIRGAECWGWATWKRGWALFEADATKLLPQIKDKNDFDFESSFSYWRMLLRQARGRINSWAICWLASAYVKNKLTLWPGRSLVTPIETKDFTHIKSREWLTALASEPIRLNDIPVEESEYARSLIVKMFWKQQPNILSWARRKSLFYLRRLFKFPQECIVSAKEKISIGYA